MQSKEQKRLIAASNQLTTQQKIAIALERRGKSKKELTRLYKLLDKEQAKPTANASADTGPHLYASKSEERRVQRQQAGR